MPFSINGFGTQYYGECDFQPDGSYVTTEWLSAFLLPLIPLRSRRVMRMPSADTNLFIYSSKGFLLIDRVPLRWPQVLRVYGFMGLFVVCIGAFRDVPEKFGMSWNVNPGMGLFFFWLFILAAPFLLPLFLRHRAKRKAGLSEAALLETINRLKARQTGA